MHRHDGGGGDAACRPVRRRSAARRVTDARGRRAPLWALLLAAAGAHGACLPLPDSELQTIDRTSEETPDRAIAAAQTRLAALEGKASTFTAAELYAIIAAAEAQLSHPREMREAISAALAKLEQSPLTPATARLRQRLIIAESDAAENSADSGAAVKMMDALIATLPTDSLERSCALISRAEAHGELNEPDLAAADAFAAYRIAQGNGWTDARIDAAYALATIYRRVGLLDKAEALIEDVIAVARSEGRTWLLASAEYIRGRILTDLRQFPAALAALESTRADSERLGDRLGVAAARVGVCVALIGQGDLDAAERSCDIGDAEFNAAHRPDLIAVMQGFRARLDLERGRPRAALAKLDAILAPSAPDVVPYLMPQFHRDRSAAYEALGRYQEAYADLKRAFDLERAAASEQRMRAVDVLSATAASDKLLADNRVLEERLDRNREDLARQRRTRQVWSGLSIVAVLICALLAYLLYVTRAQSRAFRRHEAVFRTMASHAPDAMLLLDTHRAVRFSNRNLFGFGQSHPVGEPFGTGIAPAAMPVLSRALDEIFAKRRALTFTADVADESGVLRHFELRGGPAFEGNAMIGVTLRSIDVTSIRRLEREVIDVASRERQRLSSDLHEGLGQELTGVLLLLRSALTAIDRGLPSVRELITEVGRYVSQSIETTRELARGLSPVQIARGSLTEALGRLASEVAQRLHIAVAFRSEPREIGVSDVAADHLYRIAHEAITNAARHGGCTHVELSLSTGGDALDLTITDDGTGPHSEGTSTDGLGMKMMAYRARLMGGSIRFGPGPRGGTRLALTVPLSQVRA